LRVRELAIVDASPLIFLSKVNQLALLKLAAIRVVVPHEVAAEISAKGDEDITARVVRDNADWLHILPLSPVPSAIQAWDLGAGESAVLAATQQATNAVAVLDDSLGRKCADTFGIKTVGTLGLILIAKQRGLLPIARPMLEQMRLNGMYLADAVIDRALALVGE
jgi:predicted nucleic acid-binding protein